MTRFFELNARILAAMLKITAMSAAVFCLMGMNTATASSFGVRVVDAFGQPVQGASVCIGLPGNYKQFGALFTDADGRAVVDVPNVPITVTVSKTRFSGMRMSEPARRFNFIKQVTLSEGVPGPRCRAGSVLAEESSIKVESLQVVEGVYSTLIQASASGSPNYYRVSATPEFFDADWQAFEETIALADNFTNRDVVYLQLRRYEGNSKGWIEARSKVVPVYLPVTQ